MEVYMNKKIIFTLVFILMTTFLFYSCEDKRNVVAEAGILKVTKNELKEHLNQLRPVHSNRKPFTMKQKLNQVKNLLEQKLEYLIAAKEGVQLNQNILVRALNKKEMEMFRLYQNKYMEENYLNEAKLYLYFKKKLQRAEVKHILISHKKASPSYNNRNKEQALRLADSLKKELENGANFEELVYKFSDDPQTKNNKGYLGWMRRANMDVAFEKAIYSFPEKTYLGPVEARDGYHILFVLQKKEDTPEKPFSVVKNDIRKEYERKNQFKMRMEFNQHLMELVKKYNVHVPEKDIDEFINIVQKWKQKKNHSMNELFEKTAHLRIFVGENYSYSANRLLYDIPHFERTYSEKYNSKQKFMKLLNRGLPFFAGVIRAYELELDKDPIIQNHYELFLQNGAIALLHQKWRLSIKNTTEELKEYYETHLDEFKKPARLQVWGIAIHNKEKAMKIYKQLQNNYSQKRFEEFAQKYSENKAEAKKKGYLGSLSKRDRQEITSIAFQYGPNKLIPPFKTEYYYYIIRTGELTPEHQSSFEEVSHIIDRKLFTRKYTDLRLSEIAKFKNTINPFTIYEANLREIQ